MVRRNSLPLAASIASLLAALLVVVACGNQAAPAAGGSGAGASKTKKTKAPTKAPTKAAAEDEGEDEGDEEPAPTKTAAAAHPDEGDDEGDEGSGGSAATAPAGAAAANAEGEGDEAGGSDDLLAPAPRPRGQQVHIAQILIRFRGAERAEDDITRSRDEARTLARQIAQEARSGDFAAIARQRSEDEASREGGGDLGQVERGTMPEALDRAAFALAPGAVSDVVETEFGFHVLKRLP